MTQICYLKLIELMGETAD